MDTTRWIFPDPATRQAADAMARNQGVAPLVASILASRGVQEVPENFLSPKLAALTDPFDLEDMDRAVQCLREAVDQKWKVTLYGDYDVDGITSICLLADLLHAYGVETRCFLPHRIDEGYGLSRDGVDRCLAETTPDLLVAVDCGTKSAETISSVQSTGTRVLVVDHHECDGPLPDCPLVNPKRGNHFHYLCSAGLVFKLCHAMLKSNPLPGYRLKDRLDLVALGTVADLVPLVGENRTLVHAGLRVLSQRSRPGLRALAEVAGSTSPLDSRDIGYRLAPRLNASGRMDNAMDSLALLNASDSTEAQRLARTLDAWNAERQRLERQTQLAAEYQLGENFTPHNHAAIVVGGDGWHQGVLGIVASRLMRKYHRPTVVVGFNITSGYGKGSARSIDGLPLVDALGQCSAQLEQFGGHSMAAGLSMHASNFKSFARKFLAVAAATLTPDHLAPRLTVDAELPLSAISDELLNQHDLLEPFGIGNAQPVFVARAVTPARPPRGLKEKHLRILFGSGRNRTSAIYFNGTENNLPRPPWDVAFHLERNTYKGRTSPQIQIRAIRQAN